MTTRTDKIRENLLYFFFHFKLEDIIKKSAIIWANRFCFIFENKMMCPSHNKSIDWVVTPLWRMCHGMSTCTAMIRFRLGLVGREKRKDICFG